jgi:dTDP-4-amino-4,6-dideoxygalactose transaminase
MTNSIPFHIAPIGDEEIAAVVEVLRSGWLTTGARTREFEHAFADAVGATHAVAVNSATAALHLALEAVGLTSNDEVIVPTMTFAASAEVVRYFGARPVLVDCDADTLNIDPAAIEGAISDRTKAVMPVHFGGHPCDMDAIADVASRHDLHVIEDAAHAFPASYKGRRIGSISEVTAFSFYATKTLTTGEGGMLTTQDAAHAERARIMSLHGISKNAWNRYTAEGSWKYEIIEAGFKYNLTDLAAALGLVQLRRAGELRDARLRVAQRYDRGFADLTELRLPPSLVDVEHAWHLYPIRLQRDRLRIGRDAFIEELKSRGVCTSVHFIPLHLHRYYRQLYGYRPDDFPNALMAYEEILSLPLYPALHDADVDRVIEIVADVVREFRH